MIIKNFKKDLINPDLIWYLCINLLDPGNIIGFKKINKK